MGVEEGCQTTSNTGARAKLGLVSIRSVTRCVASPFPPPGCWGCGAGLAPRTLDRGIVIPSGLLQKPPVLRPAVLPARS